MTRDIRWPPTIVQAPRSAIAWTAETGFVHDPDKARELIDNRRVVLNVRAPEPTADPNQPAGEPFVAEVEGTAPLHAVIRVDRDIAHLRARIDHLARVAEATQRYVEDVHMRAVSATEDAQQRLVTRDE